MVEQSGGQRQQGRVGPVVLHELRDLQGEGGQQVRGPGPHTTPGDGSSVCVKGDDAERPPVLAPMPPEQKVTSAAQATL